MRQTWDIEADVVVVGFGAAGACAALEAAQAGAEVVVLDRFGGGGATALSGGVVYAGGGTRQQQAAGVSDSPEAMFAYLSAEAGDAVSAATLRRFCEDSPAMLAWLEQHGVPFEGSLCPDKTSYPTNRHYLYYSGSELSFAAIAPPAPRGHRTRGPGTSGRLLYARLARAARGSGARLVPQTMVQRLIIDEDGRVTGVEASTLRDAPAWAAAAHRVLHRWSGKPYLYAPKAGRVMHRPVGWLERRHGRPLRVRARAGVVLSAGGFVANRAMMREHAPACRGGLPLGTPGDDGSGIRLGAQAGGATAFLDRVSVWRFLSPPPALIHGILVDRAGQRICDEARYGAAIGDAIVTRHQGRAWLLIDQATLAQARRQVRASTLWFQRLQAWYLLTAPAPRACPGGAGQAGGGGPGRAGGHRRGPQRGRGGRACRSRGQAAGTGPRPGPAALLADRLLGAARGSESGAGAHPGRAGGRRGHRAGAAGRRPPGAGPVRGRPQRRRPVLALVRQRALAGGLRLLRAPRGPPRRRGGGRGKCGGARRCGQR